MLYIKSIRDFLQDGQDNVNEKDRSLDNDEETKTYTWIKSINIESNATKQKHRLVSKKENQRRSMLECVCKGWITVLEREIDLYITCTLGSQSMVA